MPPFIKISKVLSTKNFLVLSIKPRFKKDQASLTKNGPLKTDFLLKDTVEPIWIVKKTLKNTVMNWPACKFDFLLHISSFLKIGIWLKFYLWRNFKVLPHSGKTFMWQKALHSLHIGPGCLQSHCKIELLSISQDK